MSRNDLFDNACEAYDREDFDLALDLFRQGAEAGDASAMGWLACMYGNGEGTKRDIDKSIYWDKTAVKAGDSVSAFNLAVTYRTIGNIQESKRWFEKAIEMGDHEAALELAKLYMVSDKERKTVRKLLNVAIQGTFVSEASREEASELLAGINRQGKSRNT